MKLIIDFNIEDVIKSAQEYDDEFNPGSEDLKQFIDLIQSLTSYRSISHIMEVTSSMNVEWEVVSNRFTPFIFDIYHHVYFVEINNEIHMKYEEIC